MECHNGRNISFDFSVKQNKIAEKYNLNKIIGSDAHTIFEIGRNIIETQTCPNSVENFRKAMENSVFHLDECLGFCHQITKVAKLMKLLRKGNICGICRIIYKRIGKNK